MDDLAEFLRARLDEDEEWLRTITASIPYQQAAAEQIDLSSKLGDMLRTVMASPHLQELTARWAANGVRPPNDLHRVLREVEAKRRILKKHDRCSCPEVLWLAAVYGDHPDYQDEWKP